MPIFLKKNLTRKGWKFAVCKCKRSKIKGTKKMPFRLIFSTSTPYYTFCKHFMKICMPFFYQFMYINFTENSCRIRPTFKNAWMIECILNTFFFYFPACMLRIDPRCTPNTLYKVYSFGIISEFLLYIWNSRIILRNNKRTHSECWNTEISRKYLKCISVAQRMNVF